MKVGKASIIIILAAVPMVVAKTIRSSGKERSLLDDHDNANADEDERVEDFIYPPGMTKYPSMTPPISAPTPSPTEETRKPTASFIRWTPSPSTEETWTPTITGNPTITGEPTITGDPTQVPTDSLVPTAAYTPPIAPPVDFPIPPIGFKKAERPTN